MASPVKDAKAKAQQIWSGASVHSRGRGWIKHKHPTQGNRYMLDTQVGGRGWHFGDVFDEAHEVDTAWVDADPILDAPWLKKMVLADYNAYFAPGNDEFDSGQIIKYVHPESGEEVAFQPQPLNWTNDLDQIDQIAIPQQVSPTIDDDTLLFTGAYGAGLDFEWQTQTARLSKRLIINSLAQLGAPPQYIIDGGNPVLALRFIFQKSSNLDIIINDAVWDESADEITNAHVEFQLNGETVWYFVHPWANDADGNSPSVETKYTEQAGNLFVEIRVPWSWIGTATFPITIDPTIDEQVGASGDDTHNESGAFGFGSGDANVFGGYYDNANFYECEWSARFTGISGLGGATITTSYTQQYSAVGSGMGYTNIYADDQQAAAAPTSAGEFDGITLTTNWIAHDIASSNNAWEDSGSLNSVIQELADSYGDNLSIIQLVAKFDGAASTDYYRIRSYDSSTTTAQKLHIEYTEYIPPRQRIVYGKYAPRFIPTAPNGGWILERPPLDVPFELNRNSPLAEGLVFWLPALAFQGSTLHKDFIRGLELTGTEPSWVGDTKFGNALLFNDASTEYLSGTTPLTSVPTSMACWFWKDAGDVNSTLISISDSAGTHHNKIRSNTNEFLEARAAGSVSRGAITTVTYGLNEWHHACAVFPALTERTIYQDGGNSVTNVSTITQNALDTLAIGVNQVAVPEEYMSGMIAEVGIWNRALSDAEVYSIYADPWQLYAPVLKRYYHIPTPHKTRRFSII